MNKYMTVINHGTNKIELYCSTIQQMKPIEFHYKEDGSIDNKPSIAIVMESASGHRVVGHMSLATLEDCLNQVGIDINS